MSRTLPSRGALRSVVVVCALLLCCCYACTLTHASPTATVYTQPLIFVSKTTSSDDVALGSSVEVVVTVHNFGQSPAYDLVITDILENGTQRKKHVDSLPYGASATMRYSVTPKALGSYAVNVAVVTYNLERGNAHTSRTSASNILREGSAYYRADVEDTKFRGTVTVLTRDHYDRLHARYVKEAIAYIFLGAMPVFFPYLLFRVKQSQVDALLRRTKRVNK